MKICLLNAPPLKQIGIVGQIYPPLGILYLASYVKKYIHDLEIRAIDGYKHKLSYIVKEIEEMSPDILGVSFTTQAATGAYEVINQVRERIPNAWIVSGGPHPTILPEEVLKLSATDIVVRGEGEETFLGIVKRKSEGKSYDNIEGTVIKKGNNYEYAPVRELMKDLDIIPFPDRTLIDWRKYPGYHYKRASFDTSIISARGCPFNCVYCSNPVWKLQKPWYRMRSPKNFVDEMEWLNREYGVKEFYDETDEFNANIKWAKGVCDEIINRKLKIYWKVQMRADNVDSELAEKMRASGCWLAFFGVETGNDKTSYGIKKNISKKRVIETLKIFKNNGIKIFALLMAFNVWEEENRLCFEGIEDTKNTLRFVKKLAKQNLVDLISWSLTTPYPGSKLRQIAIKYQLITKELLNRWDVYDSSANFVMKLPGVSYKDWLYIQREGKKLQVYLFFKSGTFNFRSVGIYIKKAMFLFKKH